jgi:hypothetical protein
MQYDRAWSQAHTAEIGNPRVELPLLLDGQGPRQVVKQDTGRKYRKDEYKAGYPAHFSLFQFTSLVFLADQL